MIKEIIKAQKNSIACIAIGDSFYKAWEKNILPSWTMYCKKNNLGLIVFTSDLIEKNSIYWKKPTWQRCLVASEVKKKFSQVKNICVMDIDILINPYSPNIFNSMNKNKINLTSLRHNLPYHYDDTVRKLAYFRKKFLNPKYPLDSLLNCSLKTLYKLEKLSPQKDELNVGVMVFNIQKFAKKIEKWFYLYKRGLDTTTLGGCQTILNYLILKNKHQNLIDYRFNSIWVFEIASRFPHILKNLKNSNILNDFVIAILLDNYFLHFAGSGDDGAVWRKKKLLDIKELNVLGKINIYRSRKLKGLPKIKIKN
jgi:hypothetical protein